jgi:hypothetical protein
VRTSACLRSNLPKSPMRPRASEEQTLGTHRVVRHLPRGRTRTANGANKETPSRQPQRIDGPLPPTGALVGKPIAELRVLFRSRTTARCARPDGQGVAAGPYINHLGRFAARSRRTKAALLGSV